MSVITVSCNPKATHAHVSITPSVKDFDMHQQSSVQRDVTNAPLLRSHGSLEDLDACSAAFYGGDGINNAYNTPHFDHASKEYNYEFRREGVRAPLRDRTYCDHQSYNVTRSRESDSVDLSPQYVSKNSNSQSRMNMDHAIRMYAHNPYKPLLMRDANGECINNGVEDGNDTPGALFYASMLPIQYSQCTPQKSGETLGPKASSNIDTMTTDALNGNETNARSSSMHGIQYVNGRPVVMKTTSTSIPQSTSSITTTPSSLLATTPNVCSSHENPFDGVQSSSDLFDHLFEEDTVAMAEDLTAPTNERFQQPQIPVHSSFSKSSAFSTSASSASVRPHLRRLPTDASSTTKLTEPLPNKYALSSSARRFVTTGNYFPPSSSVQGNSEPSDGYQSTTSRFNRQGAGTLYPDAHDLPSSSDVTNYEVEWREDISEDQKVEAVGADGHDSMFENKTEQRDMYLVQISFRHRSASYLSPFSLEVDEYCIVEGDQGHDLGRVSNITINSQLSQTMNDPNRGSRAKYDLVIRKATPMEAQEYLTTQRDAEDSALDHIRCEVLRLRLSMNVQSCEYQYDRRKLSFYFESERKVTFAPLLKCLHRHYQCRIWLQQVNRSPAHHS